MSVRGSRFERLYEKACGGLTCQTNGKFLRFARAKTRAKNFQTPALPANPSLLRRVDKMGAIVLNWKGRVTRSEVVRTVLRRTDQLLEAKGHADSDMVQRRRGYIYI